MIQFAIPSDSFAKLGPTVEVHTTIRVCLPATRLLVDARKGMFFLQVNLIDHLITKENIFTSTHPPLPQRNGLCHFRRMKLIQGHSGDHIRHGACDPLKMT